MQAIAHPHGIGAIAGPRPGRASLVAPAMLLVIWFSQSAVGQVGSRIVNHNRPGSDCYCESYYVEVSGSPQGVIVLDANGQGLLSFAEDNPFKSAALYTNFNYLFVNILGQGGTDRMNCYEVVINTTSFAKRHYSGAYYLMTPDSTLIQRGSMSDLAPLPFSLVRSQPSDPNSSLAYALANKRAAHLSVPPEGHDLTYSKLRSANYKHNLDIGLSFGPLFIPSKDLVLDRASVSLWNVSGTKRLSTALSVHGGLGVSFKIPNPKKIQSSMQSNVMNAVQNEEDTLVIDEKMTGHVMLGAELGLRYSFNGQSPMRPFVGLGIGSYHLMTMSGNIQDTIDISDVDMSDPSSMQDAMGGESGAPDMEQVATAHTVIAFDLGFEYRLGPVTKFNMALPFKFFDPMDRERRDLTFGIQIGLSFTLNSGASLRDPR